MVTAFNKHLPSRHDFVFVLTDITALPGIVEQLMICSIWKERLDSNG